MGILGMDGEYRPRYGLWIDTSSECQQAVKGLLAEGWDCDVVLNYGARCLLHISESHRPVMPLSEYWRRWNAGELEDKTRSRSAPEWRPCCYIREVFFPEQCNLRRVQP
jgi:hypothetical protein